MGRYGLFREDLDGGVDVDDGDFNRFGFRAALGPLIFGQCAQPLEQRLEFFTDVSRRFVFHDS